MAGRYFCLPPGWDTDGTWLSCLAPVPWPASHLHPHLHSSVPASFRSWGDRQAPAFRSSLMHSRCLCEEDCAGQLWPQMQLPPGPLPRPTQHILLKVPPPLCPLGPVLSEQLLHCMPQWCPWPILGTVPGGQSALGLCCTRQLSYTHPGASSQPGLGPALEAELSALRVRGVKATDRGLQQWAVGTPGQGPKQFPKVTP